MFRVAGASTIACMSARRCSAGATSFSPAPTAAAIPFRSGARAVATRPRYSATLLVAVPIGSENSSTSVPSGRSMRTPKPAGPGLPRAPPSMYATKRPALKRPAPSGVEESTGRLRNGCGEIENALTAVALDDAVVAAHVVEHLRPHADVADRADVVARLGDGDAVALLRHEIEGGERGRVERLRERLPFAAHALERHGQLGRFVLQRFAVGFHGFLLVCQRLFGALGRRVQLVGLDHQLEDLGLDRLDLAL